MVDYPVRGGPAARGRIKKPDIAVIRNVRVRDNEVNCAGRRLDQDAVPCIRVAAIINKVMRRTVADRKAAAGLEDDPVRSCLFDKVNSTWHNEWPGTSIGQRKRPFQQLARTWFVNGLGL